jgi:hypothetical protein
MHILFYAYFIKKYFIKYQKVFSGEQNSYENSSLSKSELSYKFIVETYD